MIYFSQAIVFFLSLVSADVSLQTNLGSDCGGLIDENVHSIAGNGVDSSNCQAQNQFQSIKVVSTTSNDFQCNIYSDSSCQNFLTSANSISCTNVIGTGVICFNNALFNNPFASSNATIQIGSNQLKAKTGGSTQGNTADFINKAISNGCSSSTDCDPTQKTTDSYKVKTECDNLVAGFPTCDGGETCSQTLSMQGRYASTGERDYMALLLVAAMANASAPLPPFKPDPNEPLDTADIPDAPLFGVQSFGAVDVNDQDSGANLAHLEVTLTVDCESSAPNPLDCGGVVASITEAGLAAIPGIGEVAAAAFSITCDVAASDRK